MFRNLIESGSHKRELKRRSSFFLGTLVFYAALLISAGVLSIYAYDARLKEDQELELMTLMRFPPATASAEPEQRERPKPTAVASRERNQLVERTEISVNSPHVRSDRIADVKTPEVSPRMPVAISTRNTDINDFGGPIGPVGPTGPGNPGTTPTGSSQVVRLQDEGGEPPLLPQPTPAPTPKPPAKINVTSYVLASKVISKPVPEYPRIAREARIAGPVTVQILVDETGRVVSAQATSGHPLLQGAAVRAAHQARFTPTLLGGQPVKVSGVITYNFVLQ